MNSKDLKQLNKIIQKQKPIIMLLLGVVVATVTICLVLNKYITEKVYEAKWRDYDDCGVDNL